MHELARRVDYSQHGQALILRNLITPDTPRIVVDIGAHDGVIGSNSRALLEQGWRGLLVEPMPLVSRQLQHNSAPFGDAICLPIACSDCNGRASIRFGKDGACGQMASLSQDPAILENLTDESVEVQTRSLESLLAENDIPNDFGVLLIDTEGLDLTVLRGLRETQARPRIIVTEEFAGANREKYAFLSEQQYRLAGVFGSDSIWVRQSHPIDPAALHFPILRLPDHWQPSGQHISSYRVVYDPEASASGMAVGWAVMDIHGEPQAHVALVLENVQSNQRRVFQAWRIPRLDVARYFNADHLLMSGYRAYIDAAPGTYQLTVVQQEKGRYAMEPAGTLVIS